MTVKIKKSKLFFWPYTLSFIAITIFTLSPYFCILIADHCGRLIGCEPNEAGTAICLVHGIDVGGLLSMFVVAGWFFLITVPLGACLYLGWIIALITRLIIHNRK